MIAAFYTLIGFGPDGAVVSDTDTSWNAARGVRSYQRFSTARGSLKQASLPEGFTYRILETVIYPDGGTCARWVE